MEIESDQTLVEVACSIPKVNKSFTFILTSRSVVLKSANGASSETVPICRVVDVTVADQILVIVRIDGKTMRLQFQSQDIASNIQEMLARPEDTLTRLKKELLKNPRIAGPYISSVIQNVTPEDTFWDDQPEIRELRLRQAEQQQLEVEPSKKIPVPIQPIKDQVDTMLDNGFGEAPNLNTTEGLPRKFVRDAELTKLVNPPKRARSWLPVKTKSRECRMVDLNEEANLPENADIICFQELTPNICNLPKEVMNLPCDLLKAEKAADRKRDHRNVFFGESLRVVRREIWDPIPQEDKTLAEFKAVNAKAIELLKYFYRNATANPPDAGTALRLENCIQNLDQAKNEIKDQVRISGSGKFDRAPLMKVINRACLYYQQLKNSWASN